jgi:membrane carboxypeptidase/penicillin-binding protein
MDMANLYATIARQGVHIDPVYLQRVEDRRGILLGRAGQPVQFPDRELVLLPGGAGRRVMPQPEGYVMVDMMRNVFYAGTAKKGRRVGMDFGGKTGTTSNFVDAWFVGFSPGYTVAVWIGTDGTASLGDKETGGKAALPAWSRIMEALPSVPGERFPVPEGVVLVPEGDLWLGYVRGTTPDPALLAGPLSEGPLGPFGGAIPGAPLPELPVEEPPPEAIEVPELVGDPEAGI